MVVYCTNFYILGGMNMNLKIILGTITISLYLISIGLNIAFIILRRKERVKSFNEEDNFER